MAPVRISAGSDADRADCEEVVGLGRLELPTSRLSSARSNQLSYKPKTWSRATVTSRRPADVIPNGCKRGTGSSMKKEK